MPIKTLSLLILLGCVHVSLKAQSQLDWVLKQPDFEPILKEHTWQVRSSSIPTVSIILFEREKSKTNVYLSTIIGLSEAKDHLPASFSIVNGQGFLIYDGSEQHIQDEESWFEQVKAFIGKRLCDDLKYRELLARPGPKQLVVPCGYFYDPTMDKLTFSKNGRLLKHQAVARIPYYTGRTNKVGDL